jgi:hypothetical protein
LLKVEALLSGLTDKSINIFFRMLGSSLNGLPGQATIPSSVCLVCACLIIVTWIGLNDISQDKDIQTQLTLLFQLQENMYKVGARHFVFLTVAPFDRAPMSILSAFKPTNGRKCQRLPLSRKYR